MHARLHGSKSLLTIYQIRPDFPSLADEIAEQHPDMSIKVAAFTVSEKSSIFLICRFSLRRAQAFRDEVLKGKFALF